MVFLYGPLLKYCFLSCCCCGKKCRREIKYPSRLRKDKLTTHKNIASENRNFSFYTKPNILEVRSALQNIVDICQMPNFVRQARLYYTFKEKNKTGQLSFSCRRLSQVVADYHRYQNITSGKM